MSYCRFSSGNFSSDVYCYADIAGGYTIHVAGTKIASRILRELPYSKLPRFGAKWDVTNKKLVFPSIFHKICSNIMWYFLMLYIKLYGYVLKNAKRVQLNLGHDGETFRIDTARECWETLEMLRSKGYNVPQYAIDRLKEEEQDEQV
jgi:hypothetical protein